MENLNTAFDVAEKYLDIPRMLDPEGMCFIEIKFQSYFYFCFYDNGVGIKKKKCFSLHSVSKFPVDYSL